MFFRNALLISLLSILCCADKLQAQHNFYNIDTIREIRIEFYQSNWDHILDSLYVKGDDDRMLAAVIVDGTRLD
ncbi:MAG: hypothetical protein HKN22_02660, partial [Bacteroidia bacterium]|nr:hypothetical protein [Bacteroidia bacterium]